MGAPAAVPVVEPPPAASLPVALSEIALPRQEFQAPPKPASDFNGFTSLAVSGAQPDVIPRPGGPANTFGGVRTEPRLPPHPDPASAHHSFAPATLVAGERNTSAGALRAPVRRPVEILHKPEPTYTATARSRALEGEVWLAVVFGRNAKLTVLRVVRGLGFGLDESAMDSVRKIRFRPAEENGVPIDLEAVLIVRFSLAR
ncbi:MAG: TonB family protein [Bryobacteraceae bacterium]|nr:TonB family protein [Bryobacteraceae bacterium]